MSPLPGRLRAPQQAPQGNWQDLHGLLWRLMTPLLTVSCMLIIACGYASLRPCIHNASKHVFGASADARGVVLCSCTFCAAADVMPCTSCRD